MFYVLLVVFLAAQLCRSPTLCLSPQSMAILGKWVWRNDSFYSSTVTGLMRVTLQGSVIFFLWLSAEKTAPTRWNSTSDQGPNPIREQYFHGGMKMAKVNLPSEVRFTAVPLFSQKKEVLLWYPLVVYLPVEVCIIPRWRNYPIAFPFISMAVSQLACDLSELRNLLIASLLTNFRHFFQTISLTINVM